MSERRTRLLAARTVALALWLGAGTLACYRPPPPGSGPADGSSAPAGGDGAAATVDPSPPVSERARIEAERLRTLGPTYTPFAQGPRILWDDAATRAVVDALAPVVEERGLPVDTRALLWVLVGAGGAVVDAVVQTGSTDDAFDRAALALAERLRFAPARAEGRRVPVWVIREFSLLMQ